MVISLLRKLVSKLPPYGYTPEYLGLPFPEVNKIYIGKCVCSNIGFKYGESAHAHVCKECKGYHSICITMRSLIYNSDGSPSDVMWHEYGHVLSKIRFEKCSDHENLAENLQNFGHGPEFDEALLSIGRPDLNHRYLRAPW
jgi:hypothetical protein